MLQRFPKIKFTALPQTPYLDLRGLLLREGKKRSGGRGKKGQRGEEKEAEESVPVVPNLPLHHCSGHDAKSRHDVELT